MPAYLIPSYPGTLPDARLWHSRTQAYVNALGETPSDISRVDQFFRAIDAAGLNDELVDAAFLRTTQNLSSGTALKSATGVSATVTGSPTIGAAGATLNGTSQVLEWTVADTKAASLFLGFTGVSSGQISNGVIASLQNSGGWDVATNILASYAGAGDGTLYTRQGASNATSASISAGNSFAMQPADPLPHIFGFTNDNASSPALAAYVDMKSVMTDSSGNVQVTSTITKLFIGGKKNSSNAYEYASGVFTFWVLFNRALTAAEAETVTAACRWLIPQRSNIVFMGDSTSCFITAKPTDSWPYQVWKKPAICENQYLIMPGLNGVTAAGTTTNYTTYLKPFRPRTGAERADLYVWLGINDILDGNSAATIYTNLKSLWAKARADGFTVHACTLMPGSGYSGAQETVRTTLNTSIASEPWLYDQLVRFDELFVDPTVGTFFLDTYHLTTAGNAVIANAIAGGITSPTIARERAGVLTVYKTADTSRTNTTTLADDDHLVLALGIGVWDVTIRTGFANVSTTSYGKVSPVFTGTADYAAGSINYFGTLGNLTRIIPDGSESTILGTSTNMNATQYGGHIYRFTLRVTVGGNLKVQWAQGVLDAGAAAVLKKGSMMSAVKISDS